MLSKKNAVMLLKKKECQKRMLSCYYIYSNIYSNAVKKEKSVHTPKQLEKLACYTYMSIWQGVFKCGVVSILKEKHQLN